MGDYYCYLCDETIKHKKKHLKTKSQMDLSESIFNKYCVKNPEIIEYKKYYKNMLIIIIKGLKFTILCVGGNYSLLILLFMLNLKECIVLVHVVG